jgi:hypothetical protein
MSVPIFNYSPPATFFTINGLAGQFGFTPYSDSISTINQLLVSTNNTFNIYNYIDSPVGTNLDSRQLQIYNQQLTQFRAVYSYNQAQYSTSQSTGSSPIYFRFITYKDQANFNMAVGLVNRLYSPQLMGIMFSIPFPPFC